MHPRGHWILGCFFLLACDLLAPSGENSDAEAPEAAATADAPADEPSSEKPEPEPEPEKPVCTKTDVAACEAACEAKDANACTMAGSQYEHGRSGVVIDYTKAGKHYDAACKLGDTEGCGNAGFFHLFGLGREENLDKAQELFKDACAKKSGAGCYGMALLVFDSRVGETFDLPKALAYEQQACDLGELQACSDLGTWYRTGSGVEKDTKKARTLFESACTDDIHFGCEHLAWAQVDGNLGFAADAKAGFAEMSRVCEIPFPHACGSVGMMLHDGIGTEQDLAKAREKYKYACEHAEVHSCGSLGNMMVHHQGGDKDVDGGMELLEKACTRGAGVACHSLGMLHARGTVVDQDIVKAEAYLSIACEQNYSWACTDLGLVHSIKHADKPADAKKALAAFKQACDGGEAPGCEAAADLLREDEPEDARALYSKACDSKRTTACEKAASMLENAEGGASDIAKARELYKAACDEGKAYDCTRLARTYLDSKRTLEERKTGADLMAKMCDEAKPEKEDKRGWPNRHACSSLAMHYLGGRLLPPDQAKAIELLQRGCDLGEDRACRSLGNEYAEGDKLPINPKQALELLEKACELDDKNCDDYAAWLVELPSPPGNMKKGVKLLDKACAAPNTHACLRLADLYEESANLPKNLAKSVEYSEKACRAATKHNTLSVFVGRACNQAAATRRKAPDSKLRDWDKIVELYDRACTLEYARGCSNLADLYQGGAGTEFEKDAEKAKVYRDKACSEGSSRSCKHEGH